MKKVLIYLDTRKAQDFSLIAASKRMLDDQTSWTTAIGFKENIPFLSSLYDEVLTIDDQHGMPYDTRNLSSLLQEVQIQQQFDIILFPSSPLGRILAPRLAMALHVGLVADVTDIELDEGIIEMIRPAYSGKLMAKIVSTGIGPLMMTIRPDAFQLEDALLKPTIYHQLSGLMNQPSGIKYIKTRQKASVVDIRDSKILISGGGGVLDHFDRLEALASVLNAQVAASRRVIDSGVAHRKIQVGQSGKTVSPKLYIALGISGSIQHIEGLKNVETIIAINTNKNAPICSLATLVVEGDAVEFINRILDKIQQNKLNFKEETQ